MIEVVRYERAQDAQCVGPRRRLGLSASRQQMPGIGNARARRRYAHGHGPLLSGRESGFDVVHAKRGEPLVREHPRYVAPVYA